MDGEYKFETYRAHQVKTPTTAATEAGATYFQSVGAIESYGDFAPVASGVLA